MLAPMRALELRIPPLLLTAVFLALIVAVSHWVPAAAVTFPHHQTAAALFSIAGLALLFGAALQFRMQRTTLDPRVPDKASRFVARGLFRVSRNPMYLGMALLLLGIACWSANAVAYALVIVFCIYLTEFQIKPEERALQALFGQEYLAYKARVRRWI